MNVGTGTEAAQFPKKEYINGIFVAVYDTLADIFASDVLNHKCLNDILCSTLTVYLWQNIPERFAIFKQNKCLFLRQYKFAFMKSVRN